MDDPTMRKMPLTVTELDVILPLIHWMGDAPTSLHGNGASSFDHTTRDAARVTCTLCRTLLRRGSGGV